jgi:hypothetical protein
VKVALLVAALALACSCGARNPSVAMRPVEAVQVEPLAGDGVVVFVRPDDPCAGGAYVIVDEHGEYVGEAVPASHFAVTLPAGDHQL